jgi:hypothetical protein
MSQPQGRVLICFLVLGVLTTLTGCGGAASKGPAKGSPEWLYDAARIAQKAHDWDKVHEHLDKLEPEAGPWQARALSWHMAVKAGLAMGHRELAEAYEKGWGRAGSRKSDYARMKDIQYREARRHVLHFLESYLQFQKIGGEGPVAVEFPFPEVSGAPVPELDKIYSGMWPADEARNQIHDKVIRRGVGRGVSLLLTAADDVPGAQKTLASGKADIPRAMFLMGAAQAMSKAAEIFERHKLNEPDKRRMLLEGVVASAKGAATGEFEKKAKTLLADAEKALKAKK